MKKTIIGLLCVFLLALPVSCAEMSSTQTGGLIGAGAGGVLGALIGKDKPLLGAAIGVAVGALAGMAIGYYVDKKEKSATETAQELNYKPSQGTVVKVEDVRMEPETVRGGDTSKLVVTYALADNDPGKTMQVKETRQIWSGDQQLKQIGPVTKNRNAGTYVTEQEVTFPKDLPEATYTLRGTVEAAGKASTKKSNFQVVRIQNGSEVMFALKKLD
jgi:uncharacterized protein YcfJ